MNEIFTDSGKASFSRIVGTLIIMILLVVYLVAAVKLNWETVRSMTGDLSLLAAGLYGFNKIGGYLDRNLERK